MENQFVLPRRVRAKYSTFVKTLTAIVCVCYCREQVSRCGLFGAEEFPV